MQKKKRVRLKLHPKYAPENLAVYCATGSGGAIEKENPVPVSNYLYFIDKTASTFTKILPTELGGKYVISESADGLVLVENPITHELDIMLESQYVNGTGKIKMDMTGTIYTSVENVGQTFTPNS